MAHRLVALWRRTLLLRWTVGVLVVLFAWGPVSDRVRYDPPPVTGRGWTAADGVQGLSLKPGSCVTTYSDLGMLPLPDSQCTPGGTDPAVTQANLRTTVCNPKGYTDTVRPPLKVSNAAKKIVMTAYGIPLNKMGDYKLDHLVPLSAGGSSSASNLWPQEKILINGPGSKYMQTEKDRIEIYLHRALCRGEVSLKEVQEEFPRDWSQAAIQLDLPDIPYGWTGNQAPAP